MKSKIQLLPEEVRKKIAAGEVIERPASVLKELLENAYDAGATEIKIEFSKGGLENITVYDNGEGMSPEDLKLCYHSFTTSKIKSFSDLYNLQTYGFRGEALSSIAQVSRLRIVSRERGSPHSFEVYIEFGKEKIFKPSQLKEGTLIEVRDLFENVPARKAFLKSIKTERAKNLELIKALMLTHPEVRTTVKIDGQETLNWQGGTLRELFSYLYIIPLKSLLELSLKEGPYQIDLLLTDKSLTFSQGRFLHFLVNNRLVKDERLNKFTFATLKKFYGNLGFPGGVIQISLPSSLVDFNVHPAKWEVRFKREKDVFLLLEKALKGFHQREREYAFSKVRQEPSQAFSFTLKEDLPISYKGKTSKREDFTPPKMVASKLLPGEELSDFRVIGAFLNTFILVEKEEELYVIDQHALAERIHYEELTSSSSFNIPQRLLIPYLIKLNSDMLDNLEEKLNLLEEFGFELEVIGKEELLVKGVPGEISEEAKEIIENFLLYPKFSWQELKDYLLKEIACKRARKKGDFLTPEEREFLVRKMFQMALHTCPHERPIFFKISLEEMERKLKRKL